MEELKCRRIIEKDLDQLLGWFNDYKDWVSPVREMLPMNGLGGFTVVKYGQPIGAVWLYIACDRDKDGNYGPGKVGWLEFCIIDKSYRDTDRDEAIKLLLEFTCEVAKDIGLKFLYGVLQHGKLTEKYKEIGFVVDDKPSHEMIKIL